MRETNNRLYWSKVPLWSVPHQNTQTQNTQAQNTQDQNTQDQNTQDQNTQDQNTQAQNTKCPKIPNVPKYPRPKYPRSKQQYQLNNWKRLKIKSTQNTWILNNYLTDISVVMLNFIASYNRLLYAIINTLYKITTTSMIPFTKARHLEN